MAAWLAGHVTWACAAEGKRHGTRSGPSQLLPPRWMGLRRCALVACGDCRRAGWGACGMAGVHGAACCLAVGALREGMAAHGVLCVPAEAADGWLGEEGPVQCGRTNSRGGEGLPTSGATGCRPPPHMCVHPAGSTLPACCVFLLCEVVHRSWSSLLKGLPGSDSGEVGDTGGCGRLVCVVGACLPCTCPEARGVSSSAAVGCVPGTICCGWQCLERQQQLLCLEC